MLAQFGVILFIFVLNDIWWFRHLVLNSVAVTPTYIYIGFDRFELPFQKMMMVVVE